MAGKRRYDDGCASAHALDIVGERWALLVVRELMLGAKRFTDLRAGLPGISPNVLTQRLDQLEQAGVVHRRKLPPPAAAAVYELSPWGLELDQVIRALGRWGARSPALPLGAPLSVDAFILSLATMFDGRDAGDLDGRIEIRLGDDRFLAALRAGTLKLVRAADAVADAALDSDVGTLATVFYGGLKPADAVAAGRLRLAGDKALLRRFLRLFPIPATAAAAAVSAMQPAPGKRRRGR